MSNERKKGRLVEILEQVELDRRMAASAAFAAAQQTEIDRKRELQRIGGKLSGLKQSIKRSDKIILICETAFKLLRQGEPERGLNKKISPLTNLPYEYVMKATRAASKE